MIGPSECDAIRSQLQQLDARTDDLADVWNERPEALARLIEQAETQGCEDLVRDLTWEAMLAYAHTTNAALLETDRPRFLGFHPDLLEDAALDYLVGRCAAVPSVYVRSRMQDFLWEHGGITRKRYGAQASEAYLDVAELAAAKAARTEVGWVPLGDAVVRAAKLAKAANQTTTLRRVADKALALLDQLKADGNLRHVLDMGLALAEAATVLTDSESDHVDGVLTDTSSGFVAEANYHLARAAMYVRRRFATSRKRPDAFLRDIDLEVARCSLSEGEGQESAGNALVASVAYNQAMLQLENLGADETLKDAARSAVRRTREAGMRAMTPVSTGPIALPDEHRAEIARVVETIATAPTPDCLRLFALHPNLLVTREQAQGAREMGARIAPLASLFPPVILRGGGQALAPLAQEEADRLALFQSGLRLLRIQDGLYLNDILDRLLTRHDLGPDAVVGFLRDSGQVPAAALTIIEVGIARLWDRDWVSALHILVPQLEEVMRSLVRRAGHDTMRPHQGIPGVTQEVPLGYVLDKLATLIVDDGVVFMLELVLDLYGLNLRNQVGHGLVDIVDCDIDNVARILQLYLLLSGLREQPNPQPSDAEPE